MAEVLRWHEGERQPAKPKDGDRHRPTLATFGLSSFAPDSSKPEKLAEMEIILSPGSLRDIVHLTRLAQAVYDGNGVVEKRRAGAKLLDWLDARPEIEREWMLERLDCWISGNEALAEYESDFSEQISSRLPER